MIYYLVENRFHAQKLTSRGILDGPAPNVITGFSRVVFISTVPVDCQTVWFCSLSCCHVTLRFHDQMTNTRFNSNGILF